MNLTELIKTEQCRIITSGGSTRLSYRDGLFSVYHNGYRQSSRLVIETADEAEAVAEFCEAAGIEVEKEPTK